MQCHNLKDQSKARQISTRKVGTSVMLWRPALIIDPDSIVIIIRGTFLAMYQLLADAQDRKPR